MCSKEQTGKNYKEGREKWGEGRRGHSIFKRVSGFSFPMTNIFSSLLGVYLKAIFLLLLFIILEYILNGRMIVGSKIKL